MAWEVVIAAGLALVGSLGGSILGNYGSMRELKVEVTNLKESVKKHNNLIERVYCVEGKVNSLEKDVDELKGRKSA